MQKEEQPEDKIELKDKTYEDDRRRRHRRAGMAD